MRAHHEFQQQLAAHGCECGAAQAGQARNVGGVRPDAGQHEAHGDAFAGHIGALHRDEAAFAHGQQVGQAVVGPTDHSIALAR